MSGASVTKKKSFNQCHLVVDLKKEEKLDVTNVQKHVSFFSTIRPNLELKT
jgi:hypothetical protein